MSDKQMTPREIRELEKFLEEIRNGTGPLNAAISVGWSPAQLRRMQKDPEFIELVQVSRERLLESHERTLNDLAHAGHFKALQMILFNERSERWKDVRHIQTTHSEQLDVGVVVSIKQGVAELLRENGVASMQSGGALDVESRVVGG